MGVWRDGDGEEGWEWDGEGNWRDKYGMERG